MYRVKYQYQNKKYAEGYERTRFRGVYGRLKNWNTKRAISKLIRFTSRKGLALDLPCGTGRLSEMITKSGYHWIGADISLEMMMEARKKAVLCQDPFWNIRADAERIPFKDSSIDCIFSIRFIYHIPVEIRYRMLGEMRRVTKRWLIIDYNYRNGCKYLAYRLRSLFKKMAIKKRLTLQEISDELRENGFVIYKSALTSRFFSDNILLLCQKHDHSQC